MTTTLMPAPRQRFYDNNGRPLVNGLLYTYAAGTSAPKDAYTDAAGLVPHDNPIRLDAHGEATVYWSGNYKLDLKNEHGVQISGYPVDNFNTDPAGVWGAVTAFMATLASTLGASLVGFIQSGVGAILRTVQAELRDTINARQFGMDTAASAAVNTAALLAALTEAATRGNGMVEIPAGSYVLTAGTNFARAGVAIVGRGRVVFDFSAGTGVGFKLDGVAALVQGMRIENIQFKGGPAITKVFQSRRVVRSMFRNLEAREGTDVGFSLEFAVLNTYDHCLVSDDVGSMTSRPAAYWKLDDDGVVDNHSQANLFLNCEASGQGAGSTKTGWVLANAILNVWQGGTAESMNIGLDITSDICRLNLFEGLDVEDNQTYDVRIKGYSNTFNNSLFQSNAGTVVDNVSISSGVNTRFAGCYIRKANLGIGSSDTDFESCYFDDNAANGIQGVGSFKRYNCITNTGGVGGAKTGTMRDVLGPTVATTLSLSQNNTPAQTVTLNEATVAGQQVQMRGRITANAAGTAANSIAVSLDTSLPAKASAVGLPVGTFMLVTGGGTIYTGAAVLNAASILVFRTNASTGNLGINPAVTLAAGDILSFTADYPLE